MPRPLPVRPSLEWLKKTAKDELKRLRPEQPEAVLADAQRLIAREYGFESWRKLKRHVEQTAASAGANAAAEGTPEHAARELLRFVGTGQIDEVRRVLAAAPRMVNAVGPHPFWGGRPQPLHVAIESNRPEMFQLLLEAGADVNGDNDEYDYWSPLMLAPNEERHAMRDELIRRGARVGLTEALLFGDDELVESLLRPGASALPPYAPNGGSILNFARTIYAIDRLLDLGVATDIADRWGATPIESMSRLGAKGRPLVQHLIERGVAAAPEEYARMGDAEKLASIAERDPGTLKSDAVMMGAVDFRHHALVEWLLARGGNVNARARATSRHTALHSAAWNGDLEMATLLVAAGADLVARDEEHHGTPLGWAEASLDITSNPRCKDVAAYLEKLSPVR